MLSHSPARSARQTARLLLETTDLPVTRVAFAAGFASVRQFNDTVKSVFARTPSDLRRVASSRANAGRGNTGRGNTSRGNTGRAKWDASARLGEGSNVPSQTVSLRLAYRKPFSAETLFDFLGLRAVPGVEALEGRTYTRTLSMPNGDGVVSLTPEDGYVRARCSLSTTCAT